MKHPIPAAIAACVAIALMPASANAQEAMYTEAATMPSPGFFVYRTQFHFSRYGTDHHEGVENTDKYEFSHSLQYGLARALSFRVDVAPTWETEHLIAGGEDHDKGVSDIDLSLKWRFYKNDTGGVDTVRAALIGGAYVASGDDKDFSTQSVNPHLGAVVTIVKGRHGFNQDVHYQINTTGSGFDNTEGGMGPADAFRYNSAYLFRLFPEAYTSTSTGAWYATIELNGLYETNGDHDLRWAPGLMYEGQEFAFEIMAQLPLWDQLDERPELDFAVGVGLRFAF
ncbi:MAG: hypothetical protein J0L61_09160 [Planctomycetes bacterium]|nr:hypothetical protein [Planctomycetota bacterium]